MAVSRCFWLSSHPLLGPQVARPETLDALVPLPPSEADPPHQPPSSPLPLDGGDPTNQVHAAGSSVDTNEPVPTGIQNGAVETPQRPEPQEDAQNAPTDAEIADKHTDAVLNSVKNMWKEAIAIKREQGGAQVLR